jgi:hypothetical protein
MHAVSCRLQKGPTIVSSKAFSGGTYSPIRSGLTLVEFFSSSSLFSLLSFKSVLGQPKFKVVFQFIFSFDYGPPSFDWFLFVFGFFYCFFFNFIHFHLILFNFYIKYGPHSFDCCF